jgi:hypothetical protein
MKYLDICGIHEVNAALNFETQDTAVFGGCDLYTTKAAGSDKKLYKRIEKTLEDRHKDLLATIAGMPAEHAEKFKDQFNINRETPFGSFNESANRHTFAYLIATLNATHFDYDFANTLNPDEFQRESKQIFMATIDQRMRDLRPQIYSQGLPPGAITPLGTPIWSSQSWQLLDSEMDVPNCECYIWMPSDDPFADDGAIWTHHYFLYNKEKKRVCYFYLRGISALSHSPTCATSLMSRLKHRREESNPNAGSRKRVEYWFGTGSSHRYRENGELDDLVIDHPEDIVDAEEVMDIRDREASMGLDYYTSDDDSDVISLYEREKGKVRTMSEHHTETMEI